MMARLYEVYKNKIIPKFLEDYGYKNPLAVPKIEKIVLNMGVGEATRDSKVLDKALEDLMLIAGQRPVRTLAKKSIAGFKVRQGMSLGVKVTLRRVKMYEFLDRLVNIALPRIKDFRGLSSKSFDGNGNYALGIKEQIVFPEINYDKIDRVRGLDVCIVTSAKEDQEAKKLLTEFNMPFVN